MRLLKWMARLRPDLTDDVTWLGWLCIARIGFAMLFTAYSASLPLLKSDWQMSAGEAGLVQSAYHLGFLISLFTVGFLTDRYGAKHTLLATSLAAAISGMAFALWADGFVSGLTLYGLNGLCSGGTYTPGLAIVAQRFAAHRQGRALGVYLAAASLGYAVSLFFSSAMLPLHGWRGVFLLAACGPVAGTMLAFWVLKDTPNWRHPRLPGHGPGSALRQVLANRPVMLAIWGYVFHAWELLGLWAWLPAFLSLALVRNGYGSLEATSLGATLSAFTYLAAAGGNVLGGGLSDRYGRTAVILVMSLTSLAGSFVFGWLLSMPVWLLVVVAVLYNFTAVADSSVHSSALTELVPPGYLGAAYSLRSLLGFGAGALSPWVFGLTLDGILGASPASETLAWGLAWMALGTGALCGPIVVWRLRRLPEARRLAGGRR